MPDRGVSEPIWSMPSSSAAVLEEVVWSTACMAAAGARIESRKKPGEARGGAGEEIGAEGRKRAPRRRGEGTTRRARVKKKAC